MRTELSAIPTDLELAAATRPIPATDAGFAALVVENQRRIYRVLLSLTRDRDLAENLTQECFLRAFQKRHTFRSESSVTTWLVRIAVNLVRDHSRNRRAGFWKRLVSGHAEESDSAEGSDAIESAPDPRPTPESTLAMRQSTERIWDEVARLAPQQRVVFVLRFLEEMTIDEIAQSTGMGSATVKTHLYRGVQRLRATMGKDGRYATTLDG